jgi:hypothetical protein
MLLHLRARMPNGRQAALKEILLHGGILPVGCQGSRMMEFIAARIGMNGFHCPCALVCAAIISFMQRFCPVLNISHTLCKL